MDIFGSSSSSLMPEYLFYDAVYIDHGTSIRANTSKQNYLVCPRHWYVDATFKCNLCDSNFVWTASEQKKWFEDYGFWIDSQPRSCKRCYAIKRRLASLQKEYDSIVGEAKGKDKPELKQKVISIVSELETAFTCLPDKMTQTRQLFEKQLTKRT